MSQPVLTALLNFLSALVWPGLVVWAIIKFRAEIVGLLERVADIKIAGSEVRLFQPSVATAEPTSEAKIEVSQIAPDGFFTAEGIRSIVSQILPKGETAEKDLLFFNNQRQHSWLVASRSKVVIVLDDEHTRATNRLIQVIMDKNNVLPLSFDSRGTAGVVSFKANPIPWYYSFTLFPTPKSFEDKFRELLDL